MKEFDLHPYYILRTPLLPYSEWIHQLSTLDKEDLKSLLITQFATGVHAEALYLASPSLFNRITELEKGTFGEKKAEKLGVSLLKYFTRMSTRCTPFGLFAGLNTGTWARENRVLLNEVSRDTRYSRIDMHYLFRISHLLKSSHEFADTLRYYPNSTLYYLGDEIRYIEYQLIEEGLLHTVSAIENSEYVQMILEQAQKGSTQEEFIEVLKCQDIPSKEAHNFIRELISNQLLVSELEPNLTGEDFFDRLLCLLNRLLDISSPKDQVESIRNRLLHVNNILRKIDAEQIGKAIPYYESIINTLEELDISIDRQKMFHVDYIKKPLSCTLHYSVASEVRKGLEVLNRLSSSRGNVGIEEFKSAFLERYDSAEVPLAQALDDEIGIGYPVKRNRIKMNGQILNTLPFNTARNTENRIVWDAKNQFILEKLIQATKSELYELVLMDKDIAQFESDWTNVPDTFSVLISIIKGTDSQDQATGEIYLAGTMGKGAARFIGRFTHSDPSINEVAKDITRYEQELDPERLHCEIAYLPSRFRVANVINRSNLRDYEIPLLSNSSVPHANQVPLRDIYISVKENRLILRSKSLNKEIVPKLSSMHNHFSDSLSLYQFLCDFDTQDTRFIHRFDWGVLEKLPFLPRVKYRNLILREAMWNLEKKDIVALKNLNLDKRRVAVEKLRQRLKLPRYVLFVVHDNKLLIDLESDFSLDLFVQLGSRQSDILLEEFLFDTDQALVKDEKQRLYTHEIALSFVRKKEAVSSPLSWKHFDDKFIKRSFILGDDWLYYKIYLGNKTADRVLQEVLDPLAQYFIEEGWIDQWFFIRYADPDFHLRVRWRLNEKRYINEILTRLKTHLTEYMDLGFIWKVQVDTYQREVERYGVETMQLLEKFFHLDTRNILLYYKNLREREEDKETCNLLFSLFYLDTLLSHFGCTLPRKMALMEVAKTDFAQRLQADSKTFKVAGARYKKYEQEVHKILNGNYAELSEGWQHAIDVVFSQITNHKNIYEEIGAEVSQPGNEMVSNQLLGSIIHMSLNRLYPSNANYYELIVYSYLHKYYASIKNRVMH